MQDFLKEWGPAIITAVAVLTIIGIVRFLSPNIKNSLDNILTEFGNQADVDKINEMLNPNGRTGTKEELDANFVYDLYPEEKVVRLRYCISTSETLEIPYQYEVDGVKYATVLATLGRQVNSVRGSFFFWNSAVKTLTFCGPATITDETFVYMFKESNVTNVDMSKVDFSNNLSMRYFCYGSFIRNITFGTADLSNIEDFTNAFSTTYLKEIDLSQNKLNPVKMTGMFSRSTASNGSHCQQYLKTIKLGKITGERLVDVGGMFMDAYRLENVDLSEFYAPNIENVPRMFTGCSSLTTIDLSHFNTSKVTSMYEMFTSCNSLTNIYVNPEIWDVSNVTISTNMFTNNSKLPNYNSSYTDKTKAYVGEGGYLSTK